MAARVVSWNAFRRLFAPDRDGVRGAPGRDGVRVALDWPRLAALHRTGAVRVVREDHALDRLPPPYAYYAPWYADPAGRPTDYRAADARPLNSADLARTGQGLTEEQRHRVGHFERALAEAPLRLCLPTLDLGEGRRLVLDGNHRLVALLRLVATGPGAAVHEFRVSAPLDPKLLPDLHHWVAD
ncbi:hypothetical protein [Streptomyces sp. JB150]|uniref:hypothetical protein n=1 Tax=Streptomyces sp. JB150 TaxID=2714844 RepID=UPI001409A156|nr:hypothetical protein [Streptomyces sp. JB150]QIJ62017.1 hypothetical protein G7Z13_08155 [Streptomyces sp. JB150]